MNLFELPERYPWMTQALCATIGGDLWFAEGHSSHVHAQTKRAIAICQTCPVQAPCLDYALGQGTSLEGTWAGTTGEDRRQLLRQMEYERRNARRRKRHA